MTPQQVYVASSWKNERQASFVEWLRDEGHDVYDFKHEGFSWSEVDPNYKRWTPESYLDILENNSVARDGFERDMKYLNWCTVCILLLPCGRSAHLELGYAIGQNKLTGVYIDPVGFDPDLMYLAASFRTNSLANMVRWINML